MNTISVRWQSRNSPDMVPLHGFSFDEGTGKNISLEPPIQKHPRPAPYNNWIDYTIWLAEERMGCVRVWVDGVIVWDYEHDWHYSMSDLRARVWRNYGKSPSEAKDIQDSHKRGAR